MHWYRLVVYMFALLSFVWTVTAELPSPPQCAIDCQRQLIQSQAECSFADKTCLCADKDYQLALSSCVTSHCTMKDALLAKYVVSRQCDIPISQRYPRADPGTIIPFAIATILFIIRMATKAMHLGGGWGSDDYTLTVAYLLGIVVFSVNISMIDYGFGKNIWDIYPQDNITKAYKVRLAVPDPVDRHSLLAQRFYAFVLVYKALISLAKISVCLFLLRIFRSTAFRWTGYTMVGINSAIAITWMLLDSFHCLPVHLAWTQWEGLEQGKCINFTAATFANGIVNIIVDIVMVAMPIYEVSKLNLSPRKKMGVAVMFASGLVLTIIGIVRVIVFSHNSSIENPTYEMEALNRWSVIECHIAIVCACLPATRAMLASFSPGIVGVSTGEVSAGQKNQYNGPSRSNISMKVPPHKVNIAKTVSYSVDYVGRSPRGSSNGFIQLSDRVSDKG
ncbi:hypothetical protein BDW72DRAFT_197784 [Aspergillus terricola var. indicus]